MYLILYFIYLFYILYFVLQVISELFLIEHNINKEKSNTSKDLFFKQINIKRNFLLREKETIKMYIILQFFFHSCIRLLTRPTALVQNLQHHQQSGIVTATAIDFR